MRFVIGAPYALHYPAVTLRVALPSGLSFARAKKYCALQTHGVSHDAPHIPLINLINLINLMQASRPRSLHTTVAIKKSAYPVAIKHFSGFFFCERLKKNELIVYYYDVHIKDINNKSRKSA